MSSSFWTVDWTALVIGSSDKVFAETLTGEAHELSLLRIESEQCLNPIYLSSVVSRNLHDSFRSPTIPCNFCDIIGNPRQHGRMRQWKLSLPTGQTAIYIPRDRVWGVSLQDNTHGGRRGGHATDDFGRIEVARVCDDA
jgi:hypothetical protein